MHIKFQWKFFIVFSLLLLVFIIVLKSSSPEQASAYSTNDFKTSAEKYLQDNEKAGDPITLRYAGNYYYYVPVEVNSTITGTFPGIMLDSETKIVTDETVLKELYRYPGLIKRFADNAAGFNKLAGAKVAALAKYCRILEVQKTKFQETNMQGNVVGVIYEGIKLAADAVGMVKSAIKGIAVFAKELAKGNVKKAITSSFSPADSAAILESTQKAFDNSKNAYEACGAAMEAWGAVVSTSGKASVEYATKSTEEMFKMFSHEATSISALRDGVQRINTYPKLVTKIGKTKYNTAMKDLLKLTNALKKESIYWSGENENANDANNLEMWAQEQIDRAGSVEEETPPEPPAPPVPPVSACTTLDLSENHTLYTYTPDNPGTNGPCNSFANNVTANQVSLSCSTDNRFRNHWVKKISTGGASKLKIKANLAIGDRGFFYSMCPNGGVKYDDYSSLMVLSKDPTPTFDAECNKICSQEDWPKCGVNTATNAVLAQYIIGKCGVLKCTAEASCDLEVNTAGQSEIWLVFHTSNPWPAYVTGTLSNVEVCPAQ